MDVIMVVTSSELEPARRSAQWDTYLLPVPCDLFVLTLAEWQKAAGSTRRFDRMLRRETAWVYERR